jgi:hypothetical protein
MRLRLGWRLVECQSALRGVVRGDQKPLIRRRRIFRYTAAFLIVQPHRVLRRWIVAVRTDERPPGRLPIIVRPTTASKAD